MEHLKPIDVICMELSLMEVNTSKWMLSFSLVAMNVIKP